MIIKKLFSLTISALLVPCLAMAQQPTLKSVLGKYFLVGCAMTTDQIDGKEPRAVELVKTNFNSIVAENCMKPEVMEPEEGKFNWTDADKFVQFGIDNGMKVIGHTLVWHDQTAPWMFKNKHGELPSREEMIRRMKDYIFTVVGRYKGKVYGWDVSNECFLDDGSWRESPWYRAIGPDFLVLAFKFAHEADPDAELYYNDYSMSKPGKMRSVVNLVKTLKAAGCRIDAIGMQSHNGYDYPDLTDYENTIKALIATGVKVNIAELDVNMLPYPKDFSGADINLKYKSDPKMNPYTKGLTKEAQQLFNDRYMSFFRLYYKYRDNIGRVCTWGITDNNSWLNDWPIKGRTNYGLLFDRNYKAKPVVSDIIKLFQTNSTSLKEALGKYFLVGAAVDTNLVCGHNPLGEALVREQFNSIVAENCMKGEEIHPAVNSYDWKNADKTVEWGLQNGQAVIGHCLVWHSQPPKWMFTDEKGDTVSRETLIGRMYSHIMTVMSRYRGKVKGWDVVNEAILDDGSYRPSPYYKIIGPEYIELAFRFAHEADPDAELYINDYSMSKPGKRETYCRIIKDLKAKGLRIDGIGLQSHHGYDYPDWTEYEKSIEAFEQTGVKLMLTEVDMNMLPNPKSFGGAEISQKFEYEDQYNPYRNGITKKGEKLFNERYLDFFKIVARHKNSISRLTFWGVSDANSWLNDWPIKGRTNYPLLFDRNYKEKPIVKEILKLFE